MNNLFCNIKTIDSVRKKDLGLTNPLTTHHHPQHHQISPTIFLNMNNHQTCSDNDMNIEIIDISDDDEEEVENTFKNGTSIDNSSDEEEIEVIQLSDDDDDDDDDDDVNDEIEIIQLSDDDYEMNDETSNLTLNKHNKINQFHNDLDDSSLDLTKWMQRQQQPPNDFEHSSGSSTSQTEHQLLNCPEEQDEEEDNTNEDVVNDHAINTLGFLCSECTLLINSRPILEQHLTVVHGKLFRCMIRRCKKFFATKSLLNQHYVDHNTNQNSKLICSALDCQFETSTKKRFAFHLYQYHEEGLFQCAQCLKTYSHRFMVNNHFKAKHGFSRK